MHSYKIGYRLVYANILSKSEMWYNKLEIKFEIENKFIK